MNKILASCSILLIWLFSLTWGVAQTEKPFGFHFTSKGQKLARIPIDVQANLVILKVTIDNSDTLQFILDTGVSSTIITDPKIAEKIGFQYVRTVQISGAGEEEPLEARVSIGHTLRIGDVRAYQQNLVVLTEDVLHLSEFLGVPIHGIFGYDLFSQFVVTIDFDAKEIFFRDPNHFNPKRMHGTPFPLTVTQTKPFTEAVALATDSSDKPQRVRLVIDTGAGHALLLNQKSAPSAVSLPKKTIRSHLGRGLSGEINGQIGRMHTFRIGPLTIHNMLASFPDSSAFGDKFPTLEQDRQGSLGGEFLRRFRVTFHYKAGLFYLKPVRARLKEPYEHDMSGMEIRIKGEDLKTVVIHRVIEQSPAYLAGVRSGDEIIFVNNRRMDQITVTELYKLLASKEGKDIELFLKRDQEVVFAYFQLRRFI